MIPSYMKQRFNVLQQAARNGDLALIEARRSKDGTAVFMIAAVAHQGEEMLITPLGELCSADNPYEFYKDPTA